MKIFTALVATSTFVACFFNSTHAAPLTRSEMMGSQGNTRIIRFDGEGLVASIRFVGNDPQGIDLSLSGRTSSAQFPVPVVDNVKSAFRRGNTLVLIGGIDAYGNVSSISAIDLETMQVRGSFLAYSVSVSPDESKIAYVRFYPLHFTDNPEDQYFVVSIDELRQHRPTADLFGSTPGGQMLVSRGQKRGMHNASVDPKRAHALLDGAITWSDDSGSVAMVDVVGGQAAALVLARVDSSTPEVRRFPLPSYRVGRGRVEIQVLSPDNMVVNQVLPSSSSGGESRRVLQLGTPESIPQ